MFRYFNLQIKRIFKFLPFVFAVALVLLIGISTIFGSLLKSDQEKEENTRFRVAITGDTENKYMQWGMATMQTMDQSKFTIDLFETTTEKAEKMLKKGDISAYVIFPDNFIKNAIRGDIEPLKYVTTTGSTGLVPMFKNEITRLATELLIYSEKGVYGIDEVLTQNGHEDIAGKKMDLLNVDYLTLILRRGDILDVQVLGVADGLSLAEYYVCGIIVLLLLLIGIPFATMYIKKDHALNRLLLSKGTPTVSQVACEYFAHFLSLLAIAAILLCLCGSLMIGANIAEENHYLSAETFFTMIYKIIPVVLMIAAFNLMVFELSSNLVNGILLHFFSTLSLCYISGCFFPIYSFPKIVQQFSVFLPTGVALEYLRNCVMGEAVAVEFLGIAAFAAVFFGVMLFARHFKTVMKNQG